MVCWAIYICREWPILMFIWTGAAEASICTLHKDKYFNTLMHWYHPLALLLNCLMLEVWYWLSFPNSYSRIVLSNTFQSTSPDSGFMCIKHQLVILSLNIFMKSFPFSPSVTLPTVFPCIFLHPCWTSPSPPSFFSSTQILLCTCIAQSGLLHTVHYFLTFFFIPPIIKSHNISLARN